jgi:hypothetical protein
VERSDKVFGGGTESARLILVGEKLLNSKLSFLLEEAHLTNRLALALLDNLL